ncbi:MAG: MBL fold metallo-hydrolase [Myxococcales bacterium]|nr:MBL fold metallo-hydrolase [Myxococcales bacterium]
MANTKAFFDTRTYTLTYVVWDPNTKEAVVIDPVLDYDPAPSRTWTESVDEVTSFLRDNDLSLRWVLETHAHADHLSASQILKKRFDAKVAIGARITVVQDVFKGVFDLGESFSTDGSQFDRLLAEGDVLEVGGMKIETIATPGHTPACVTYKIDDAIFTGDALFMDDYGTGRCDFPKGSAEDLYDSLVKLYALPDETRVFVGHDYQPNGREVRWETTIAKSKANNPQMKGDTSRDEFITFRKTRDATLSAPKLLLPSVQVNVAAGKLPSPHGNGQRYLNIPLNLLHPADEYGEPVEK